MKFTGIPVLFIPGHGGSFKQARSLASVTTHRTMDLQSIFHFDFFTSDFNGEYSALYGGTLKKQHEFIICSIRKILSLYPPGNRPESVIIIGHSMGGIVAKSLFLSSYFVKDWVKLIITLATPHKPVLLMDGDLYSFYNIVDEYWAKLRTRKSSRLGNITLISIGGGARDMLVRPGLTYDKYADLNVLTNAVPNVITSTDHLCIVWCNNFIKTLSRALYDAVDFEVKGITLDKDLLKNIFYYHLVRCSNGKYYTTEIHQERLKFSRNNTVWKEIKQTQISLQYPEGLDEDTYVMIKKPARSLGAKYDITIEATNIDKRDWIAECAGRNSNDDGTITCEDGVNLSQFGVIGFNKTMGKKYFQTTFNSTKEYISPATHYVVKLPAHKKDIGLAIDIYDRKTRIVQAELNFLTFYKQRTILKSTEKGALRYKIYLNGLVAMWKAYRLYLTPHKCTNEQHLAYAVFKSPWNHDSSHAVTSWEEEEPLKLILLTIPPYQMSEEAKLVPSVELILDPACRYSVQVEASYMESLGLIATRYSFALFANVATILLLVLVRQYAFFQTTRFCLSFFTALQEGAGPWYTLPVVRFITYSWENVDLSNYPFKWDTLIMQDDTADGIIVPIVLYFVAFGIVHITATLLWIFVLAGVKTYRTYFKCFSLIKIPSLTEFYFFRRIYARFPVTLGMLVFFICFATCGSFGLLVGLVIYFLKICRLYKQCLEAETLMNDTLEKKVRTIADDLELPRIDCVHLHVTLFLLWTLNTVVYLPSLAMWFKNLDYEIFINEDPSYVYSAILALSISVIWYCDCCPYVFLPYYKIVVYPLFVTTCSVLLMCQVNIYRLPSVISAVFVAIAVHQYLGLVKLRKWAADEYRQMAERLAADNATMFQSGQNVIIPGRPSFTPRSSQLNNPRSTQTSKSNNSSTRNGSKAHDTREQAKEKQN
ncbi:GPI inositol-deacylase isoform X2 [Planococcus citri]